MAGLTTAQAASSYVSLTMGWFLLPSGTTRATCRSSSRPWPRPPSSSAILGLAMTPFGVQLFIETERGGVLRFAGAANPPWLAMLALVGVAASLLWWRLYRAAAAAWLGPAAAVILALTVSRGALVAMAVLLMPTVVRFVRHRGLRGLRRPARLLAVGCGLAAVLIVLAPVVADARRPTAAIPTRRARASTPTVGSRRGSSSTAWPTPTRSSAAGSAQARSPTSRRPASRLSTTSTCGCTSKAGTSGRS